ncbi:MAG: heliorhodopsin HeR [Actinomycetota bacterium]|nr:heliorhodopsin HeR [Actinomycetota bacterium]
MQDIKVEAHQPIDDRDRRSLRRLNATMAVVHAVQAALMIALSNSLSLPVTGVFANGPPGQPEGPATIDLLFSYRLGWAIAAFEIISAAAHAFVASPWGHARHMRELEHHRNRFRWTEYSLSASLMIVIIAGVTGITDIAALIALFGINASMILFGWLMETTNEPGRKVSWTPFGFGCVAGVVPWAAIVVYLIGAGSDVPTFVYGIFVSLFVFFNCFAITQLLQYRASGRWANYLFGERVYTYLSLIAKSLLAWQVFANVLI